MNQIDPHLSLLLFGQFCTSQLVTKIKRNAFPVVHANSLKIFYAYIMNKHHELFS